MRHHEVVPGVGPESPCSGPMRSRAGGPPTRRWTPGRIALLLLAAIGLPWLPAFDLATEGPPLYRARGRSGFWILRLAFRPDGRTIATIDERGRVRLLPIVEGEGIERDVDVGGFAKTLAFSPDGREVCRLDGRAQYLRRGAFSPDGRTLAATGNDEDIRLWDLSGLIGAP